MRPLQTSITAQKVTLLIVIGHGWSRITWLFRISQKRSHKIPIQSIKSAATFSIQFIYSNTSLNLIKEETEQTLPSSGPCQQIKLHSTAVNPLFQKYDETLLPRKKLSSRFVYADTNRITSQLDSRILSPSSEAWHGIKANQNRINRQFLNNLLNIFSCFSFVLWYD